MSNILLTGGAGYIGSHTAVALIERGDTVVLLDNFINSSPIVIDRIERITGVRPLLIEASVLDASAVERVLREQRIEAVIQVAALKAVGESVAQPLAYYHNNVTGLISVLQAMQNAEVSRIVLSSSATVYGAQGISPMGEDAPISASNPYGQSKVMMEHIVADLARADVGSRHAMLRYSNPAGAHPSGLIGEHPSGVPNNLMPYVQQVAVGLREKLSVYGDDYDTRDGTGERDYIHVMDLARGHVLALAYLLSGQESTTLNLGTGQAVTVLEMLRAFEQVSGRRVAYQIAPRRAGDLASVYADPTRAQAVLGFKTQHSIEDMCRDAWRWQSQNPTGYDV